MNMAAVQAVDLALEWFGKNIFFSWVELKRDVTMLYWLTESAIRYQDACYTMSSCDIEQF